MLSSVTARDIRHIARMRDELDDSFDVRMVLHTGLHSFPISDRMCVASAVRQPHEPAISASTLLSLCL
jgi:hypothetical protein